MTEQKYTDENDLIISIRCSIKRRGEENFIRACEAKKEISYLYQGGISFIIEEMFEDAKNYMTGNKLKEKSK